MVDLIEMLKALIQDPSSNGILALILVILGVIIPFVIPFIFGSDE